MNAYIIWQIMLKRTPHYEDGMIVTELIVYAMIFKEATTTANSKHY